MNKPQEHIANSPLVRAAIVEAVHRFYYDRILSDKLSDKQDLEETQAGDILGKLWNLHPSWRQQLLTIPTRYKGAETNSIPADGRPKLAGTPFTVQEIIFQ